MTNRAYLCRSDLRRTSPSFENRAYRPERNTVACSALSVPLLWLALFRVEDLRTDTFEVEGESVVDRAPVASTRTALGRLAAGAARLEAVFPRRGGLGEHAAALAAAIRAAPGRYLTIELDEIAALWPRRAAFDDAIEKALRHVGGGPVAGVSRVLAKLGQLHAGRPFPPARGLFDRPRVDRADAENLVRLLGASHLRPVPWEDARPRPPAKVPSLVIAVEAGDLAGVDAAIAARPPGRKVADHALDLAAAAGARAIAGKLIPAASPAGRAQAMRHAAAGGHVAVVTELLAAGADPNGYDRFRSSLWQQVFWGKLPPRMLDAIIAHGGDVDRKMTAGGGYPLVCAAWIGKAGFVAALLRRGANPHVLDPFRRTPLAIAARAGHTDAVRVLIRAGSTAAERLAAIREARRALTDPIAPLGPAEQKATAATIAVLERARAPTGASATRMSAR